MSRKSPSGDGLRQRDIGLMRGFANRGGAGPGRDAWKFGGPRHTDQGAQLGEPRLGLFQALIGITQLLLRDG